MADVGFRDLLGAIAPGRRTEPTVAPPPQILSDPAPPPALVTPPPPPRPSLFGPDARPADVLGMEPTFGRIAELVLHRRTGTPFLIGVIGASGSGKSFALGRIAAQVAALAAAAEGHAETPFHSRIHLASIDAAALEGEPSRALAAKLHDSLHDTFPDLARDIGHLARDPHAALREGNGKLDDARRRLDGERRVLDDVGSRRARLIETVLYETAGSAVDAYARANRAGLERRFAGFGLRGDAMRNFKDAVLNAAGAGGRLSLAIRALWAFRGQLKLILAALALVAAGIGLGIAIETKDGWLDVLRGNSQAGAGLATWLDTHIGLLGTVRTAAFVGAALCIVANLWRASAFLMPVFRGASLLGGDLDGRRRDLDGLYAHQIKRVDMLEGDVERLTRDVGAMERRAGSRAESSPFGPVEAAPGSALFAALALAARGAGAGPAAPRRIVVVVDGLEASAPARAQDILSTLKRCLGEGMVALVALDAAQVPVRSCETYLDVPVILPSLAMSGAIVARLSGDRGASPAPILSDAATSSLEMEFEVGEVDLLAAVGPLAGSTPRAQRRFVDLYRLARLEGDAPRGSLALALAAGLGATDAEREALAHHVWSDPSRLVRAGAAGDRLGAAAAAAARFDGAALGEAAVAAAFRQAGRFVFPRDPSPRC